jgi:hypothetical protein
MTLSNIPLPGMQDLIGQKWLFAGLRRCGKLDKLTVLEPELARCCVPIVLYYKAKGEGEASSASSRKEEEDASR